MNIDALTQKVTELVSQNRIDKALELCEQALKTDMDQSALWVLSGKLNAQNNAIEEAEKCFRMALEEDSRSMDAHASLAKLYHQQERLAEAEEQYRKALQIDSAQPELNLSMGNLLKDESRLEASEEYYRAAIQCRPDFVPAYVNLGSVLVDQDKFHDARDSFQTALRYRPNALFAHIGLGRVSAQMNDPGNAVVHFQRAVEIKPDSIEANIGLASSLQGISRHNDAVSCYERVLAIEPDNTQARHMLAAITQKGAPSEASAEYVTNLFDSYADHFDDSLLNKLDYQVPELLNVAVRTVLDGMAPKLDVLDLGCGTGLCGSLLRDIAGKLVGMDLSPRMLDKARERNVYDGLYEDDIVGFLSSNQEKYDLIVSADVFVYIGDLEEIYQRCKQALNPGGLFAFSIERADGPEDYRLLTTGRYAHSNQYIRGLADRNHLDEVYLESVVSRKENNKPIQASLAIFKSQE